MSIQPRTLFRRFSPSHRTYPEQACGLGIFLFLSIAAGLSYSLCLGVAMWLLWRTASIKSMKLELSLFVSQLLFQVSWVILSHQLLALVILLLLWCNTLIAALLFWKKDKLAGLLLAWPLIYLFYYAGLNMLLCIGGK